MKKGYKIPLKWIVAAVYKRLFDPRNLRIPWRMAHGGREGGRDSFHLTPFVEN